MTGLPTERLGTRSWAIATRHVGGKVGVVVGSERTLVIDAGADPAEGAAVLATAARLGHGRPGMILTHGHWDHVRGLAGMAHVEVLVHRDAMPSAEGQLIIAARSAGAVDGAEPRLVPVEGPVTLDLGGARVEVIDTPGHAPGSVCVRVPEDGVLYGGDTVVTAIPPVFADGHSTILERTLREVATLDIEVLVPGHGRVVRGASDVRATILRRVAYLADTRERVAALFGPHDRDEVVSTLALKDPSAGPFDADLVPVSDLVLRHERMVSALVAEVGLRPEYRAGA